MRMENAAPVTLPIALAMMAIAIIVPSIALGSRASDTASTGNAMAPTVAHAASTERSDRLASARIAKSAAATHVEVIGDFNGEPPRIVLLGPDGTEIYRTEPVHNRTIVAKDVIIPSITVRDEPGATTELVVVAADEPNEAPAVRLGKAVNE
ncbi:MAG: hypothetical protein KDJ62_03260 [Rhodobiaceae bacterium]|nr:hypothetical protein [Rhodobiaceae bacterium]MCC0049334.1 hypothetical protein [Rhodobiaceae bacterium]